MKQLTCIVCPLGCRIAVEIQNDNFVFSGNSCSRGEEFASKEIKAPMRSLTTTVRTVFPNVPVIPVRTNMDIPKHLIPAVMRQLADVLIREKISIGTVVISNILETGCDIIVTSDVLVT